MQTQIESARMDRNQWLLPLGEILMVFLPVIILTETMSSWAGDNVMRGFVVVWCSYAIMLAVIWAGMKARKKTWGELGLTFKRVNTGEFLRTVGLSLLVFILGVVAYLIVPVIASLVTGATPAADYSMYDYLRNNLGWLLFTLTGVYIVSSFGEEVIFRAFLIDRISEIVGSTSYSKTIAIVLSSVLFGLIHYKWGLMGVIQTGFFGLAMGICYVKLKRRLWVLVLAHVYMDTLLLVQIYFGG